MNGQATYREDLPLVMNRKGYDEQTWFTFSYSPVRDETGKVAGMFCACSETTQRINVIHVTSAEAALGALANGRVVDFVLSDVMMPGGVNGLQLAREIRRRHPGLSITLMTGYVESAADMADGEFNLLQKPYTLEDLATALNVDLE
jgi:DNA-binding NtrC family response regulator